MSDLYDSLEEDESDGVSEVETEGKKSMSDSLDSYIQRDSSRLNNNGNFLPEISNTGYREKGEAKVVDKQILSEQGLQVNEDGSISKSPDLDFQQLPFVTREYQNLLFQRRATYAFNKTKSHVDDAKGNRRKTTNPGKQTKIRVRSLSCSNGKNLLDRNLTDAMKEKLMEKHLENSPGNRLDDQLRKMKPIANYLRQSSGQILSREDLYQRTKSLFSGGSLVKLPAVSPKSFIPKRQTSHGVFKNRSDISLNRFKPQLSYKESYQKRIGFNPLYLRYDHPKCFSDTNRSNYGDSVAGDLPEVSSRAPSTGKIVSDDGEYAFYRSLMEKEKRQRMGERTTRSEAQIESVKLINLMESNLCKDRKELKTSSNTISGCKKNAKLTAIDLSSSSRIDNTKKNCHFCSFNSTSSVSKAELALKARAYGFMANARNVFKWKSQSMTTSDQKGDKAKNKSNPNGRREDVHFPKDSKFSESSKRNDATISQCKKASVLTKRSSDHSNGVSRRRQDEFPLPRFDAVKGNFASDILQQMRYCLEKDISYSKKMSTRSEQALRRIHMEN